MRKKKKILDKYRHRKIKAADDFRAQLEDVWHLLAKRRRLGRKELIIKTYKESKK
tara:strand:- start:307 stop:471 length:165 start_codon:yes stop_codon:yes gene_type:complete